MLGFADGHVNELAFGSHRGVRAALSIQHSKGRYVYFFCLGQKNDPLGTCREPYIAADDLEAQVEDLYRRIQLPESWAERLREEIAAEITERQAADAAQRVLLTGQLAKAEGERRKLLDAYYGGAIDVPTLKTEQTRIGSAIDTAKDRLVDLDANVGEQQEILELAASLATRCGDAYRKSNDRTRKLFNAAVFERLDVKGGRLCHEQYRPPFDGVFTVSEFEYGTRVAAPGSEPRLSPSEWRCTPYPPPLYFGDQGQVSATYRRRDHEPELHRATGTSIHYLATGASTDGPFGLYRWEMGPGPGGPGPHFHRTNAGNTFYVLEGSIAIFDGEKWIETEPGDWVHVPPGGLHGFKNTSGLPAKMLLHFAPGVPREECFAKNGRFSPAKRTRRDARGQRGR